MNCLDEVLQRLEENINFYEDKITTEESLNEMDITTIKILSDIKDHLIERNNKKEPLIV